MIKKIGVVILVLLMPMHLANAKENQPLNLDSSSFATIPILHEGRIKPIDSFARAILKKISGHDSLRGQSATNWLIEALFDPATAVQRPCFKIRNPDILQTLALPYKPFYTFTEVMGKIVTRRDMIQTILQSPHENWTQSQNDLITLQQNLATYEDIINGLTLFIPISVILPPEVPNSLKPYAQKTLNYRDALKFNETLNAEVKKIIKHKGDKIDEYTPAEQQISLLSFTMAQLSEKGERSITFRILPDPKVQEWSSPWQTKGLYNAELLTTWQNLVKAYHEGNSGEWKTLSRNINNKTLTLGDVSAIKINIEYAYNLLHPNELSLIFYLLGLALICMTSIVHNPALWRYSFLSISCGALIHVSALIARIYILERPPVSTLYESILFVGVVIVSYGLVLWLRQKEKYALIGAAIGGIILHLLAFSHSSDGDSMIMLDAVLNTNFWLATHVLCITTGYAFCLATSALAHIQLVRRSYGMNAKPNLQKSLISAALLALFFSTAGTILGGIWADQSWGRFWGWDPKENGALLIVLWLLWALHGRISSQMREPFFLSALACLSVIVSLSWFGVNLLGVGLHSYGFINSLAWGLGAFVAIETLIITFLLRRAHAT